LNHDQPAAVPIQEFPTGGLFVTTPINNNPVALSMFMPFAAVAAGLTISPDGSTLLYSTYLGGSSVDNGEAIAVPSGPHVGFNSQAVRPASCRHVP
jgi:hypothetical protein